MKTTKSKFKSLSARLSSPRNHSSTFSKPDSNSVFNKVNFQTPVSLGAINPIGTLKSITLSDWWLTKKGKEKKSLCITGFESKGGSEVRLFSSGTIVKRHNSVTLEAIDGITICISGFINRSRALENGISDEVCNRFQLGFPYNWEDYNEEEQKEKKCVDRDSGISFDDIPVSMLNDLSSVQGSLKDKVLVDVVKSLRDLVCQKSEKECEKSSIGDDDRLVSRVVGVKTRAMRRRLEEDEASVGKRVKTMSKKKRYLQ